jgi:hypothetical protein
MYRSISTKESSHWRTNRGAAGGGMLKRYRALLAASFPSGKKMSGKTSAAAIP